MDTANALGTNHRLHLINKRDSSGLNDQTMRRNIRKICPDYIYLHLGVNDVHQKFSLKVSLINYYSFILFAEEHLPKTKIFLSLPIFTGDPAANDGIAELRDALRLFVSKSDNRPLKERTLFTNPNNNFMRSGRLVPELYASDSIHLTERGKSLILANMRHSIHEMTRIVLNKPRRERTQSQRQLQTPVSN